MGSGNPICQVRVDNLEAELSRNMRKDSILTENTPTPDVQLGYDQNWQKLLAFALTLW